MPPEILQGKMPDFNGTEVILILVILALLIGGTYLLEREDRNDTQQPEHQLNVKTKKGGHEN